MKAKTLASALLLGTAQALAQAQDGVSASACAVASPDLAAQRYEGACEAGWAHGFGRVRAHDGSALYEGFWVAGRRQGWGRLRYASGDVYDGMWHADRRQGPGQYRFGSGSPWHGDSYTGTWAGDLQHGQGQYRFITGDQYTGRFEAGAQASGATPEQHLRLAHARRWQAQPWPTGLALCSAGAPALAPALPAAPQTEPTPPTPPTPPRAAPPPTGAFVRAQSDRILVQAPGAAPQWWPLVWWQPC